jgi:hypothetical protein
MLKISSTYQHIALIVAAAVSIIGAAFAIDGRYAKAGIETTVMEIKQVVCITALESNLRDANRICADFIRK